MVEALERSGELVLEAPTKCSLLAMSAATIERKLQPARRRLKPRGLTTTRAGTLLKRQIPVRTFADWQDARPGFTEVDLVAHCGGIAPGASPYGALDMAGNVWELVEDWYGSDYYTQSPRENPAGPSSGEARVSRGGAWDHFPEFLRAAARLESDPTSYLFNQGFRCARGTSP
jgi:formylglycine-generating enzyme required for sulfatase activity